MRLGIIGGGVTGLFSAFVALERPGIEEIVLFDAPMQSKGVYPPSKIGPLGLEVQSGHAWNHLVRRDIAELTSNAGFMSGDLDEDSSRWLTVFANYANDDTQIARRAQTIYSFNQEGGKIYAELATNLLEGCDIRFGGNVRLYSSKEALERAQSYIDMLKSSYEKVPEILIGEEAVRSRLPAPGNFTLPEDFFGGIYFPEDGVINSLAVQQKLRALLQKRIQFVEEHVESVELSGDRILVHSLNGDTEFDKVIIASGAQTEELVPSMKGKVFPFVGSCYEFTAEEPIEDFGSVSIGFDDACFILKQVGSRSIRAGGTVILRNRNDNLNQAPPSSTHVQDTVERFLGQKITIASVESGYRPMTVDDLPIIETPQEYNGHVVVAIPTGHLGALQAPAVGRRAVSCL